MTTGNITHHKQPNKSARLPTFAGSLYAWRILFHQPLRAPALLSSERPIQELRAFLAAGGKVYDKSD